MKAILVILFCTAITSVCAQKQQNLRIGERVPDFELSLLNGKKSHLSDYGDKLIVLDFWATWCGTCLHKFPMLDSIEAEFPDDVQVILVNSSKSRDTRDEILESFDMIEKKIGYRIKLSVALDSNSLSKNLFVHVALPHYVLIKNSKVMAITSSKYITRESLRSAIYNHKYDFPLKDDITRFELADK